MPYIRKETKAGKTKMIEKHYSSRYGKRTARRPKQSKTSPAMERVNQRMAENKLAVLLNANFKGGDFHVILTYRPNERPTPQEARKNLEQFTRKLRGVYRKQGREMQYISVTEYQKAAIHHHVIIKAIEPEALTVLWLFGLVRVSPLDESGNYRKLAEYLIKETAQTFRSGQGASRKRWNESKNLIHPKTTVRIIKAGSWVDTPRPVKGYYIDKDSINTWEDEAGRVHQSYILVKIDGRTPMNEKEGGGKMG